MDHSSTPTISLDQKWQKHRYAKTILATKKVRELALRARFFSFGRVGVLDFCSSCCVPIKFPKFPMCSQYLILFAISSPLENLYIQPKGRGYNISILGVSKA
jgi:hypothetical protein